MRLNFINTFLSMAFPYDTPVVCQPATAKPLIALLQPPLLQPLVALLQPHFGPLQPLQQPRPGLH
jgi:hypothetical protein